MHDKNQLTKACKDLNERQKEFCRAYITLDFNGTKAAIKAGYSKKTAGQIASELLTNPKIKDYLKLIQDNWRERLGITRERISLELQRMAFVDTKDFYNDEGELIPIHKLPEDASRALVGFEATAIGKISTLKKIKADKAKALEMLIRMEGYEAPIKTENINTTTIVKEVFKIGGKEFEW